MAGCGGIVAGHSSAQNVSGETGEAQAECGVAAGGGCYKAKPDFEHRLDRRLGNGGGHSDQPCEAAIHFLLNAWRTIRSTSSRLLKSPGSNVVTQVILLVPASAVPIMR